MDQTELAVLQKIIKANEARAVERLAQFVNQDSGSRDLDALETTSHWVAGQLARLGFSVRRRTHQGYGPTLVGRLHGRGNGRVLLLGHYDTVFATGEAARRPFRVQGGRAYGPGVADMKGGLVTMWEALRALGRTGWDKFHKITVVHNADEEITSAASRPVLEAEAQDADYCLVYEPARPDGALVTARKGVGRVWLRIDGRAAHAGVNPEKGASAVVAMAHKILALHALNDPGSGVSVNSVVQQGGTRSNTIPDAALVEVDFRFTRRTQGERILARLQEITTRVDLPGTTASLSGGIHRPPFVENWEDGGLADLASEAAAAAGFSLSVQSAGGGSDANLVAAVGVPTLDGMGPIGGEAHTKEEYIELDSLPQRALFSALLIRAVCLSGRSPTGTRDGLEGQRP